MNGIAFAQPLFLYLLVIVPVMVVFYYLSAKVTASVRMPGLQSFAEAGPHSDSYSDIFFLP